MPGQSQSSSQTARLPRVLADRHQTRRWLLLGRSSFPKGRVARAAVSESLRPSVPPVQRRSDSGHRVPTSFGKITSIDPPERPSVPLHRRGHRPREGMSVCLDTALAPWNQDSSSGWLSLTPVPLLLSIHLSVMFRARPSARDRPQLSWSTRSDFSLPSLSEPQLLRRQEAKTTGPAEALPSGVPRILLGPDETRSGTHQNKFTHTVRLLQPSGP